jgi:hypothetical protein
VAKQVTQSEPIPLMNCIVCGIAIEDVTVDGHGTIGSYRAVIDKLFQIRPVVFVVASCDARRAIAVGGGDLAGVLTRESDGRGVLMELAKPKFVVLDSPEDDGREQAGSIGAKEVIHRTTTTVIVEKLSLTRKKTQVLGYKRGSPRGHGIQGFAAEKEIADQDAEDGRTGHIRLATRQASKLTLEQSWQIETVEQVADDGGSIHLENFQARAIWQSRQGKRRHGNLTASRAMAR